MSSQSQQSVAAPESAKIEEETTSSSTRGLSVNLSGLMKSSSILTRAKFFRTLSHWAFTVCDADDTGRVNKDELYAGILLVHVNLAKYVGAAACYPPRRAVVDQLFGAFDTQRAGTIGEDEFFQILQICTVDIAKRIAVYFAILILLVPYLAEAMIHAILHLDELLGWNLTKTQLTIFQWIEAILSWNQVAEQVLGLGLLFLIIPIIFAFIDQQSTEKALAVSTNSDTAPTSSNEDGSKANDTKKNV